MDIETLKKIGLTEGEAKVYKALLQIGTTTTGPVVKRSGVSASKVYEILNRLTDKGLVSHIMKAKTKYFRPADPERILDYLDEKEKEILQKKEDVRKLIPQLKATLEESEKREAEIFEGKKGIENIFLSILSGLKKGEEYYIMGESYDPENASLRNFFERYHRERMSKGIKVKTMMNYDVAHIYKNMHEAIKRLPDTKFMPQEIKTPAQIVIWKDNVSIIMWQDRLIAFTMSNKYIAESFKIYFDSIWNQKVRVYTGYEAFKYVWMETLTMGDHLYTIGAKGYFFDKRMKDAMEVVEFTKKRGVKWKNILDRSSKGHIVTRPDIAETRYFKEKITAPGVIWICGGRIMISNWAKEEPIFIVIDDKDIADSYRNYFEILWGMAKP